jgi:tRNA nucleotidyltransferase (CCA-adding enzyme)
MRRIDAVVDILWSQLYRTQRALVNLMESNDFEVIKSAAWSDERALNIIMFELESSSIPRARKHYGPPISRLSESSSFLSKHVGNTTTIAGPWIEDDRWTVLKRRPFKSARALVASTLRSGGTNVGVAQLMVQSFKKDAEVYEGLELGNLVSVNRDFAKFMRSYLAGRPAWFD